MAIKFSNSGTDYSLNLDGTADTLDATGKAKSFGRWSTDQYNQLEVTSADKKTKVQQPATWSTASNVLSVTPSGSTSVDLLADTQGNLSLSLAQNELQVDPNGDGAFTFVLHGSWSLAAPFKDLQYVLAAPAPAGGAPAAGRLDFDGLLNDSTSQFTWTFETPGENGKYYALTFAGKWQLAPIAPGAEGHVMATFNYQLGQAKTAGSMTMPMSVGVEPGTNKLLLQYEHTDTGETWGVGFTGAFKTKGGAIVGYSAEVYDSNGQVNAALSFDFKFDGAISKDGAATSTTMSFDLTIAGATVTVGLTGTYRNLSSNTDIVFNFRLVSTSQAGAPPTIAFNLSATVSMGKTQATFTLLVDGKNIDLSLSIGTDVMMGGSRAGTVYGKLDFQSNGSTYGVTAMFGIHLN